MSVKQGFNTLLLGEAGSGKSTFINYITNFFHGCQNFEEIVKAPSRVKLAIPVQNWETNVVSQGRQTNSEKNIKNITISQTSECTKYTYNVDNQRYLFIDTPGFNDTSGTKQDKINFNKIIKACEEVGYLNAIVLTINGTNSRLSHGMQSVLETIKTFMPDSLTSNIILVLTNCDENSCNFAYEKLLNGVVNYKKVFMMQNSLLRWDNKKKLNDEKYEIMESHFEESTDTIFQILIEISKMSQVSCDCFTLVEETKMNTKEIIEEHINKLTKMFKKLDELKINQKTIKKADETMRKNLEHEKRHKIDIVRFGSERKEEFEMILDNNSAKHQYNHALKEKENAKIEKENIKSKIDKLEDKIYNTFKEIKQNVEIMKKEFKGFNFVNEFYESIENMKKCFGEKSYYYLAFVKLFDDSSKAEKTMDEVKSSFKEKSTMSVEMIDENLKRQSKTDRQTVSENPSNRIEKKRDKSIKYSENSSSSSSDENKSNKGKNVKGQSESQELIRERTPNRPSEIESSKLTPKPQNISDSHIQNRQMEIDKSNFIDKKINDQLEKFDRNRKKELKFILLGDQGKKLAIDAIHSSNSLIKENLNETVYGVNEYEFEINKIKMHIFDFVEIISDKNLNHIISAIFFLILENVQIDGIICVLEYNLSNIRYYLNPIVKKLKFSIDSLAVLNASSWYRSKHLYDLNHGMFYDRRVGHVYSTNAARLIAVEPFIKESFLKTLTNFNLDIIEYNDDAISEDLTLLIIKSLDEEIEQLAKSIQQPYQEAQSSYYSYSYSNPSFNERTEKIKSNNKLQVESTRRIHNKLMWLHKKGLSAKLDELHKRLQLLVDGYLMYSLHNEFKKLDVLLKETQTNNSSHRQKTDFFGHAYILLGTNEASNSFLKRLCKTYMMDVTEKKGNYSKYVCYNIRSRKSHQCCLELRSFDDVLVSNNGYSADGDILNEILEQKNSNKNLKGIIYLVKDEIYVFNEEKLQKLVNYNFKNVCLVKLNPSVQMNTRFANILNSTCEYTLDQFENDFNDSFNRHFSTN